MHVLIRDLVMYIVIFIPKFFRFFEHLFFSVLYFYVVWREGKGDNWLPPLIDTCNAKATPQEISDPWLRLRRWNKKWYIIQRKCKSTISTIVNNRNSCSSFRWPHMYLVWFMITISDMYVNSMYNIQGVIKNIGIRDILLFDLHIYVPHIVCSSLSFIVVNSNQQFLKLTLSNKLFRYK